MCIRDRLIVRRLLVHFCKDKRRIVAGVVISREVSFTTGKYTQALVLCIRQRYSQQPSPWPIGIRRYRKARPVTRRTGCLHIRRCGEYRSDTFRAATSGALNMPQTSSGALNKLPLSIKTCLLYTSPSPRDQRGSRMPSSA